MSNCMNIYDWHRYYVKDFPTIYNIVKDKSLIDEFSLRTLYFDSIYASYLDGDFAECGCMAGGSSFLMGTLLRPGKRIFVLDSFQGLPEPTEDDLRGIDQEHLPKFIPGTYSSPLDTTRDFLAPLGDRVKIIPGWFNETLVDNVDEELSSAKFSLVHIDVDLYQSYKLCIDFFKDRMVPGGMMVFDEYDFTPYKTASIAINEYLDTIEYTGFKYSNRLSIIIHGRR